MRIPHGKPSRSANSRLLISQPSGGRLGKPWDYGSAQLTVMRFSQPVNSQRPL